MSNSMHAIYVLISSAFVIAAWILAANTSEIAKALTKIAKSLENKSE